jgi:IS30 family transposase
MKLTPIDHERILSMHRSGMSSGEIANMIGVGKSTVKDWLKSQGIKSKYLTGGMPIFTRTSYVCKHGEV